MSENSREDEELKKALQRIYQNIDIPDSSKSWAIVQKRLNKRKRLMKRLNILKVSSAIIVCSLMINLVFMISLPEVHSQVSGLFKRVSHNLIEIFLHQQEKPSDDKAKTPPPPDDFANNNGSIDDITEVSLEEAKIKASFQLLIPTYIPEEFKLETVRLFSNSNKINNVHIKYSNSNGDIISVLQQKFEGVTTDVKATMAIGSGNYKEVIIGNNTAILMIADKGNPIIEWFTEDYILLRISGKVSENELVDIANSLK